MNPSWSATVCFATRLRLFSDYLSGAELLRAFCLRANPSVHRGSYALLQTLPRSPCFSFFFILGEREYKIV